ncbi:MAG: DNA recombination protein RmuC [Eubacterium sp.]|nr:DNA recombination protein RmuC [Oscillospiraceae bacterium]MDY4607893.1 DNA recombination protein RmuC [Eubacterium sp.]
MEILILALSVVCIVLLVVVIALVNKNKPQQNNDAQLIGQKIDMSSKHTSEQIVNLTAQMQGLTEKNYQQQIKLMETLNVNAEKQTKAIGEAIASMQESNEKRLDEMRKTVDEKLNETLQKRLNSSFEQVSKQLQDVYKSLGEMKELSGGVTENVKGLNRVLTNVKSRGTWAEVQLGNILDQTIPNMYETNVRTNKKYNGQVEFAIRIPNADDDTVTWLPVDSKFPMEDYARLSAASESGNLEELEKAKKALEQRVKEEGKAIKNYIAPPDTTPFAIMYLATEGLYAEITSSKTGIAEKLQADGIMIAGPSTITALLNSLAMGFRSIAINEKANEVWKVLGAAKTQYEKFGDLLAKARKKVDEAGKVLDEADHRNSIIQKNLRTVETLESNDADSILGIE